MGGLRRQLIRHPLLPALALALLAPPRLSAQVRFEVSGAPRVSDSAVAVLATIRNAGNIDARDVFVEGELAGRREAAQLGPLASGTALPFTLSFPGPARPGRHALTLQVEYKPAQPAEAVARQQPALLLMDLGETKAATVLDVRLEPVALDVSATAWLTLRSLDRAPHRATLRVLLATGVNVLEAPPEIVVPAAGDLRVPVRLVRGDAPRGGSHEITAVVTPVGEATEAAAAARGEIAIAGDPARLPLLRPWLFALGAMLLLYAIGSELLARRGPPPTG